MTDRVNDVTVAPSGLSKLYRMYASTDMEGPGDSQTVASTMAPTRPDEQPLPPGKPPPEPVKPPPGPTPQPTPDPTPIDDPRPPQPRKLSNIFFQS
jgi:hypothetical protein